MKGCRMDVETLSKAELLMLLSILEGELEAQDVVIHTLRAQQRDAFVQERYAQYDLRDPFVALLRDGEVVQAGGDEGHGPVSLNPIGVLRLVMAHCTHMKEKMMKQLSAAERRHRRVIADLEEEKRRRAQDAAVGDDITAMLERERDRLLEQLAVEKAEVEGLKRERLVLSRQAEEDLVQQQQLSSSLAEECQRAAARAEEESQRSSDISHMLELERSSTESLRRKLESEHARAQQTEARAERQLAEFDTEREQMRGKLKKEEKRYQELQDQFNSLKKDLEDVKEVKDGVKTSPKTVSGEPDGKITPKSSPLPKLNGHHMFREADSAADGGAVDNGVGVLQCLSPSSPASSSLGSSPCSSPVLSKRQVSLGCSSPTYPTSFQAGINQRFQAARHKFQQQAEADHHQHPSVVSSPRDLSPTTGPPTPPDNSTAKQMARNTVTQVLSRFTGQQATSKPSANCSPFGTDYRNLASPTSKSPVPSPGIRSPIIPRVERSYTPPVPAKKQGANQIPGSPLPSGRGSHFHEHSGSCGLTSSQEEVKELDLVVSSTS